MSLAIGQHNVEIQKNLKAWNNRPTLRLVYKNFHRLIAQQLNKNIDGSIVELGSGIGKLRDVIPECILTDLFPNPQVDQIENAYRLSFKDSSVSNLILFDVFHHLLHPGTALQEFYRVLVPKGRIIIFDPYISFLGIIVYGLMHPEPISSRKPIKWFAPSDWSPEKEHYYAAQGNATRIFFSPDFKNNLSSWKKIQELRLSAISYVATGGFSRYQLYPHFALPFMENLDKIFDFFPKLFATRLLVVLEKQ